MAKKAETFKIEEKKKAIIIYTNVEPIAAEESIKMIYINSGYKPFFEEKKKGITIEEMREELKKDKEALAQFNEKYNSEKGFHVACKYYNEWKQNCKVAEIREKLKDDEKALAEFNEIYNNDKDKKSYSTALKYFKKWEKNNK